MPPSPPSPTPRSRQPPRLDPDPPVPDLTAFASAFLYVVDRDVLGRVWRVDLPWRRCSSSLRRPPIGAGGGDGAAEQRWRQRTPAPGGAQGARVAAPTPPIQAPAGGVRGRRGERRGAAGERVSRPGRRVA
jgi:hypothetical protein